MKEGYEILYETPFQANAEHRRDNLEEVGSSPCETAGGISSKKLKELRGGVSRRHPWWKRGRVGLNGLDAYFTFLFGACFADPDDTAANCV